jgi:hypothetical protein
VLLAVPVSGAEFHVSPSGSDTNPGTGAQPFATLDHARDAMRTAGGGGDIILHGGNYVLGQTLILTPQDSGTRYVAAKGETPVLTSAREIKGWRIAPSSTPGLRDGAKGKLFVADIPKGWRFHFLYVNGRQATRSRSVNHEKWREWGGAFTFGAYQPTGQTVTFEDKDLIRNLPSNGDVEMCAILAQFGVMGGGVMTDFNPETGTAVWHSKQLPLAMFRKEETAFRLENAVALIDEPGEWAVDSAAGKVYYWPLEGEELAKVKVTAPTLCELIRLQGDDAKRQYVRNVVIEGLTMVCTDRLPEDQWPENWTYRQWENPDAMIFMEGVEDCAVRDCRLFYSGSYGITFYRHALRNEVSGCEIGWTGSGGVQLFGLPAGYRDESRFNTIRRNYIHHQGCAIYWHSPNIQIFSSGDNLIDLNFLALSAYNNVSMTGVPWHELNITSTNSEHSIDVGSYPPEVSATIASGKPYFTQANYRETAVHTSNNKIVRNVCFECHTKLEEGGAIYAWCPGNGNQFLENLVYKSHELPGSSILSLDDHSENFTLAGNVVWCEGRAGAGTIGVRDQEKGNIYVGNVRAFDKYGDAKHCESDPGREKFDALYKSIKEEVAKEGGWPGNPELDPMIERLKAQGGKYLLSPEEAAKLHKTIE